MPELSFFIGKGGVGKTTVSTAYAIRCALQGSRPRVLLVSTDPAHSISDVLGHKLPDGCVKLPLTGRKNLSIWEINSQSVFRSFLDQHKQQLVATIERGSLFTADEIASLLETALPGMSEVAALLAIQETVDSGEYSHVVVDTAPFGHTLRLFGLPEQFSRLLNFLELSADRDRVLAEHFGGTVHAGGLELIDNWRAKISRLRKAFDAANVFLVTTAESFALNESIRCMREVRALLPETALKAVVLNRVVLRAGACLSCRKRAASARTANAVIHKEFPSARLHLGNDPGVPILGIEMLRTFGSHVFDDKPLKLSLATRLIKRRPTAPIKLTREKWPELRTTLSFVIGKGGVGKTTVSAGLAFSARQRARGRVEICSVDPAPSLDDIFQTPIGDGSVPVLNDSKLRASELDSVALFKTWVREIRAEVEAATSGRSSGVHIDLSYERKIFSELLEIVPPGLDEILAIFRIVELASGQSHKLIVDMAPTGHALELLRMPERILTWSRMLLKTLAQHRKLALAREAAVKIAELEVRARELSAVFRNGREARIFAVMLPEPLPDRETERLLEQLQQIGLHVDAIFVNRVLQPEPGATCARCNTASEMQRRVLANLKKRFLDKKIYAIRDFNHELAGRRGLRELTRELWRLN